MSILSYIGVSHTIGNSGNHSSNGSLLICIPLVYILPASLYGLHIFKPNSETVKPIDIALKRLIKQVLSISEDTGYTVLPMLTGILPAQAVIKMNALAMFGSICRDGLYIEHELAY